MRLFVIHAWMASALHAQPGSIQPGKSWPAKACGRSAQAGPGWS